MPHGVARFLHPGGACPGPSRRLHQGPEGNTGARDVDDWITWLGELRPERAYVTTVAEPALEAGVRPADSSTLERIAGELERRTNLRAEVLP